MRKIERELKNDKKFQYFSNVERYDLWKIGNKILQKIKNFDQYFNVKITTDDKKIFIILNNNKDLIITNNVKNINVKDSKTYVITNFEDNGNDGIIEISKVRICCTINNKDVISKEKVIRFKWIDNHVDIKEN